MCYGRNAIQPMLATARLPCRFGRKGRTLIDNYETMCRTFFFVLTRSLITRYRHLTHAMTSFSDIDHAYLLTVPTLVIQGAERGSQIFLPYRLGMLQHPKPMRRDAQGVLRDHSLTLTFLLVTIMTSTYPSFTLVMNKRYLHISVTKPFFFLPVLPHAYFFGLREQQLQRSLRPSCLTLRLSFQSLASGLPLVGLKLRFE